MTGPSGIKTPQLPELLLRHPVLVLVLTLGIIALGISGLRSVSVESSYRIYFDEDNPELLALESMERRFVKNRFAFMVIAPKEGDIFNPETLRIIAEATERAWQIPRVSRVDSLSNYQWSEAVDGDFIIADLYSVEDGLTPEAIEQVRAVALGEPRLLESLVAADGTATGINMQMTLPDGKTREEISLIADKCRDLASEFRSLHPDHEFRLTGQIFLDQALPEATLGDIAVLYPMAIVLMMAALGGLLNSLALTLVTLVMIIVSIVATIGFGALAGIALSPPAVQAPVMILCMAIANSVHLLEAFVHGIGEGLSRRAAVAESLRINLQPVALANITTAIGFLSLNLSEVPPFRDLGNLVAIGVALSGLLSLTLLPTLLCLLPIRVRARAGDHTGMARLGAVVLRHHRRLLVGGSVLVAIAVLFIPRNELNDVYSHWFDETFQFRRDTDFMEERLTGLYAIDYVLDAGEAGGVADPAFLDAVDRFSQWLRQRPEIRSVSTITDTLRHVNMVINDGDEAFYRVPQSRELAAQYLLLYEMSLPYGLDLNNELNVDKSAIRLVARANSMATSEMLALERDIQEWLRTEAPAIASGGGTGTALMFSHIGERNIRSMLAATTLALVLISALLMLAFRSLRFGLLSLVPNLVPAATAFGLWGLFVGEVGLGLSIVTGITLGIVVDDTVHFMSKYLRARRERGLAATEAVHYAFRTVGRAMFVTSVVLVVGFLVVATSHYQVNAQLGLLTALVVGLALLADFLLLPGLLIRMDTGSAPEQGADPTSQST